MVRYVVSFFDGWCEGSLRALYWGRGKRLGEVLFPSGWKAVDKGVDSGSAHAHLNCMLFANGADKLDLSAKAGLEQGGGKAALHGGGAPPFALWVWRGGETPEAYFEGRML